MPIFSRFLGIFAIFAVLIGMLSGCTYSINMVHSSGSATDLIDENQTASPDVSPTLSMPLAAGQPSNLPPQHQPGMNGPDRQKSYTFV